MLMRFEISPGIYSLSVALLDTLLILRISVTTSRWLICLRLNEMFLICQSHGVGGARINSYCPSIDRMPLRQCVNMGCSHGLTKLLLMALNNLFRRFAYSRMKRNLSLIKVFYWILPLKDQNLFPNSIPRSYPTTIHIPTNKIQSNSLCQAVITPTISFGDSLNNDHSEVGRSQSRWKSTSGTTSALPPLMGGEEPSIIGYLRVNNSIVSWRILNFLLISLLSNVKNSSTEITLISPYVMSISNTL